jgi:hypothetical protein
VTVWKRLDCEPRMGGGSFRELDRWLFEAWEKRAEL